MPSGPSTAEPVVSRVDSGLRIAATERTAAERTRVTEPADDRLDGTSDRTRETALDYACHIRLL